ncbi:MAG: outer membrane protein [Desulforhopalus sp.]
MKKKILVIAALTNIALPMNSVGAENYYLRGGLGIAMPMNSDVDLPFDTPGSLEMSYDTGFIGNLAVGYDFSAPFRLELEYLLQNNDIERYPFGRLSVTGPVALGSVDLTTQAFMINGYYDIDTESPWTPFVGLGAGWGNLDLDGPEHSPAGSDNVFAYQLMGGVSYALNEEWSVDVQYRHLGTSDATIDDADFNMNSNDLILGIRYNF